MISLSKGANKIIRAEGVKLAEGESSKEIIICSADDLNEHQMDQNIICLSPYSDEQNVLQVLSRRKVDHLISLKGPNPIKEIKFCLAQIRHLSWGLMPLLGSQVMIEELDLSLSDTFQSSI